MKRTSRGSARKKKSKEEPEEKKPQPAPRTAPITRSEIVAILDNMGRILEIKGENVFKVRAFQNAAREIEGLPGDLEAMVTSGELLDVPGIGKSIFGHIKEMLLRGTFKEYEELKATIPVGLLQVMRIPGMGPKKIKAVYEELGVKSVDDLEKLAKSGRIADLEGFGERSQEKILEGIERYRRYSKRHYLSEALEEAEPVYAAISKHPDVQRSLLGGSIRRRRETIKDIDILVSAKNADGVMDTFTTLPNVASVAAKGDTKSSVVLKSGINADLRVVSDEEFPFAAMYFTGSKQHNTDMRARAKKMGYKLNEYGLFKDETPTPCNDEAAVFEKLGLDYIEPELRESMGEIDAAEHHTLPKLVTMNDMRGLFHVHTTYSDGTASMEDMAEGARKLGYEYLGISDHSKTAAYAGGLSPDKVNAQSQEIKSLNASQREFTIFHGIESDILADGSLDYPDDVLELFDFVIASIHSPLGHGEAQMTKRIVRAIENPYTTILGHPTGRVLLSREGYPVDLNSVIEAAAAHGVAIEINSHPFRLDLDWRFVRKAKHMGVKLVIGPDAHAVGGMRDATYGVGVARKGWLEPSDLINTMDRDAVAAFLESRRKARS